MRPPFRRILIGLLMLAGIFAVYGLFMWGVGAWLWQIIHTERNNTAYVLFLLCVFLVAALGDIYLHGEIRLTKKLRWRPKPPPAQAPTDAGKVLELRPDEYRERHQ